MGHDASDSPTTLYPCLKERQWVGRDDSVCRLLWDKEASEYMPWVAVGYDHPRAFEFIATRKLPALNATADSLMTAALANLRKRAATWERFDIDIDGQSLKILACGDDSFAAERILDRAFLGQAERMLGTPGLCVGVPRRGLLMATTAIQDLGLIAAFASAVAQQFARGESAPISPLVFLMKHGEIIAFIEEMAALLPAEKR